MWQKKIFCEPDIDFDCIRVVPQQPFLPTDSPVDFFEKFFTEDVFQNLATQTNVYAQQCKLRYWTDTCVREMKAYVGIVDWHGTAFSTAIPAVLVIRPTFSGAALVSGDVAQKIPEAVAGITCQR